MRARAGPHRPRLVVSRSTCPQPSPFPHANSFIIGTAVINTHTRARGRQTENHVAREEVPLCHGPLRWRLSACAVDQLRRCSPFRPLSLTCPRPCPSLSRRVMIHGKDDETRPRGHAREWAERWHNTERTMKQDTEDTRENGPQRQGTRKYIYVCIYIIYIGQGVGFGSPAF